MPDTSAWMKDADWALLSGLMRQPTSHMFVGKGAERQHGGDAQRLVRRLKDRQVYSGWRLEVDRFALGIGVTAFVFVKLMGQGAATLDAFRHSLSDETQVIRLITLSGEFDFLVEVVGRDVASINSFRSRCLNANDLVKGTTTMISLD